MQSITSREAQLRFGAFSREAQKDAMIVTSHGHPVFMTVPVRMTAAVAELIGKVNPAAPGDTANRLDAFFNRLAEHHPAPPALSEKELSDFIQSPD